MFKCGWTSTRLEMMESVEPTGASLIKTHSNMSTNEHSLTFGTSWFNLRFTS